MGWAIARPPRPGNQCREGPGNTSTAKAAKAPRQAAHRAQKQPLAPWAPTAPDSQHPQAVEGAVVLVLPRPFVILEVFDILHHLDRKKPSFNGVSV